MKRKYSARFGALIIRNKKILLVSGKEGTYWTPGGKAESGESPNETLKRELKEELGVKLTGKKFYRTYYRIYKTTGKMRRNSYYLTSFAGKLTLKMEVKRAKWFSRRELKSGKVKLFNKSLKNLLARIVKEKLV